MERENLTKKQLEIIQDLKKKYPQYEKVRTEDIFNLERIRKSIARIRD